ncbi:MAG: aspartate--tRNA ligase [Spirochaeta sp. LUC14_002_19_P3]|nr:MAG: aspartate--tRNA ligase [Spirochaeta sp. LUC14_002_19_P3]
MNNSKRTATCGELTAKNINQTVTLNGWIHRCRNHGGLLFFDLRDRYGITQIVIDESQELTRLAGEIKMEYCVAAVGTVRARPAGMINKNIPTGEIEIALTSLEILNTAPPLPFMVDGEEDTSETIRLKHRYLDLRSEAMKNRLKLRHEAAWSVRRFLTEQGFWEIETPTFIKSTPEGARDYLVPSRTNPGKFYALPQSPQLYKQILMAGGTDRYYQIARCYRDEDARGDRQPEFTQIDLEMSFADREDILALLEEMMSRAFREVLGQELTRPFPRLSWRQAMDSYGTDKPDLRCPLQFADFSPFAAKADFGVFKAALESGGVIKAMVVKNAAEHFSRKKISELEEEAKKKGAKGLAWFKLTSDGLDGGIGKFFNEQAPAIREELGAAPGDIILLMADQWLTAVEALGAVRSKISRNLELAKPGEFQFCWIIDFPLFEPNPETGGWAPVHHMFSMPQKQYHNTMEENPAAVIGDLYDLVLNGNELGSGSVRIHNPELQSRVFDIVGFPREEAQRRFGFLLEALRYGAPPHAGFAVGFDRLVMLMSGAQSLREVIAFPKNTQGISPLDGSPSQVDAAQLEELRLKSTAEDDRNGAHPAENPFVPKQN